MLPGMLKERRRAQGRDTYYVVSELRNAILPWASLAPSRPITEHEQHNMADILGTPPAF